MKHVIWQEGSSGPGIDQARGFLCGYFADLLNSAARKGDAIGLPATGPFDANLRTWIRQFQAVFNRSTKPAAMTLKHKLPHGRLPDGGEIDWRTRLVMGIDEKLAGDDAILLPDAVVAKLSPLTALELKAAPPREHYVGNAYRVENLDKLLAALGLTERRVGTVSTKRIAPLDEGRFLVPEGHALYAAAREKSECAALVQSLGVPNTNRWRRGPHVQDIEALAPGTVIATLGEGVYLSDYSGKSHVGIFLDKTRHGLVMLDQWAGSDGKLGIRFKPFSASHHDRPVNMARLIDPNYSYRSSVIDKDGRTSWRHDYSLKTLSVHADLTGDGSAYYILLDDGHVARHDSPDSLRRTKDEDRQVVRAFVNELFEGVDIAGDAKRSGERLREALEGVKPPPLAPR
jgi:hypothetical protein